MVDTTWLEGPEDRARRLRPVAIHEDGITIEEQIDKRLRRLRYNTDRFEWKPYGEHPSETTLWRGKEQVGSLEWKDRRTSAAVASALGAEMDCSRGRVNWTAVRFRAAGFSGTELRSGGRRARGRLFHCEGRPAFRSFWGGYSKWLWIADMAYQGLISFETKHGQVREIGGVEVRVAKSMLSRPETPYLVVAGWYLLTSPLGGFPWAPRQLYRLPV